MTLFTNIKIPINAIISTLVISPASYALFTHNTWRISCVYVCEGGRGGGTERQTDGARKREREQKGEMWDVRGNETL